MGLQVKVARSLVFGEYANTVRNIKGTPMTEKVYLDDHFLNGYAENDWLQVSDGGTWTDGTGAGGTIVCTTDASDNGLGELYRVSHFVANKNCGMEARIKIDVISLVGIVVGFADTYHNTANRIAYEMNAGVATQKDGGGTDGAAFVYDTDAVASAYYCAAIKANTESTPVAAVGTLAPVADTYARLRVQFSYNTSTTYSAATFYYNGVAVGYMPNCTTSTAALCPYVAVIERSASARILTIDRVTAWQDE